MAIEFITIEDADGVTRKVAAELAPDGSYYQVQSVAFGTDGAAPTLVSSASPLPVELTPATATAFSDTGTITSITKLRGLSIANTSLTARAQIRLRNSVVGGTILATVTLAPGESVDYSYPAGRTAASGTIYMQLVSGTVEGSVYAS